MNLSRKLLLVDDEIRRGHAGYMGYYVQALEEAGYTVVGARSIDAALEAVSQDSGDYCLVVADVMMPAGRSFSREETVGGLRTGVFLCDKLREIAPKVPMLILTNSRDETTMKMLQERSNVVRIVRKSDCTPYELSKIIAEVLQS